jgi:hypothetical protein
MYLDHGRVVGHTLRDSANAFVRFWTNIVDTARFNSRGFLLSSPLWRVGLSAGWAQTNSRCVAKRASNARSTFLGTKMTRQLAEGKPNGIGTNRAMVGTGDPVLVQRRFDAYCRKTRLFGITFAMSAL